MTINAWAVEILETCHDEEGEFGAYRFIDILRAPDEAERRAAELAPLDARVVPLENFDWNEFTRPFIDYTDLASRLIWRGRL